MIFTHYHYSVNNLCEDEGSYERQDTRDTKFAKKNQWFPYWDLHNHSSSAGV